MEHVAMAIRVLLADDHKLMCEGMSSLLEKDPAIEVIALAENGLEAVNLAEALKPDIVVMDITMPDLDGIEACKQILAHRPETIVIAVSVHSEPYFVRSMLNAGAKGYLSKMAVYNDLTTAIHAVSGGEVFLGDHITMPQNAENPNNPEKETAARLAGLSIRECEIIALLAEGFSTTEIASKLDLSENTIGAHRQNIMKKLDLHSIAELTKFAIREKFIGL